MTPDTVPAWEKARRDPVLLERIMRHALRDGDMKAVHAALTLMATVDPHRAELLLDVLRLGLSLATTDEVVGSDAASS